MDAKNFKPHGMKNTPTMIITASSKGNNSKDYPVQPLQKRSHPEKDLKSFEKCPKEAHKETHMLCDITHNGNYEEGANPIYKEMLEREDDIEAVFDLEVGEMAAAHEAQDFKKNTHSFEIKKDVEHTHPIRRLRRGKSPINFIIPGGPIHPPLVSTVASFRSPTYNAPLVTTLQNIAGRNQKQKTLINLKSPTAPIDPPLATSMAQTLRKRGPPEDPFEKCRRRYVVAKEQRAIAYGAGEVPRKGAIFAHEKARHAAIRDRHSGGRKKSEDWKNFSKMIHESFKRDGVVYKCNGQFEYNSVNHELVAELVEHEGQRSMHCTVDELMKLRVPAPENARAKSSTSTRLHATHS